MVGRRSTGEGIKISGFLFEVTIQFITLNEICLNIVRKRSVFLWNIQKETMRYAGYCLQEIPKGMDLLFNTYYSRLVVWADTFLKDIQLAEGVVQEFFIAFGKKGNRKN